MIFSLSRSAWVTRSGQSNCPNSLRGSVQSIEVAQRRSGSNSAGRHSDTYPPRLSRSPVRSASCSRCWMTIIWPVFKSFRRVLMLPFHQSTALVRSASDSA